MHDESAGTQSGSPTPPTPRTTRTYAKLEISPEAFAELADKLLAADYEHAFLEPELIDMHGIALAPKVEPETEEVGAPDYEVQARIKTLLRSYGWQPRPMGQDRHWTLGEGMGFGFDLWRAVAERTYVEIERFITGTGRGEAVRVEPEGGSE